MSPQEQLEEIDARFMRALGAACRAGHLAKRERPPELEALLDRVAQTALAYQESGTAWDFALTTAAHERAIRSLDEFAGQCLWLDMATRRAWQKALIGAVTAEA